MHKMNIIFAAAFAGALALGGVNVFMAADAAKPAAAAADKDVIGVIDKESGNIADKSGVDAVGKEGVDAAGGKDVNLVRRGRKIQVDGFLLEWRGADANVWPGSDWRWDAVSTADGVAGYVSLPAGRRRGGGSDGSGDGVNKDNNDGSAASAGSEWIFKLRAVNTGRSMEINLPGPPSGEFFAFDKEEFDSGGPLTAEWVVPWEFFEDGADSSAYKLSISASAGGGALRPLVLTVESPAESQGPGGLLTRLVMLAVIAALTVTLVVIRRRQMRERL